MGMIGNVQILAGREKSVLTFGHIGRRPLPWLRVS